MERHAVLFLMFLFQPSPHYRYVSVYQGKAYAAVYEDEAHTTPLANPFLVGGKEFTFYLPRGEYKVVIGDAQ